MQTPARRRKVTKLSALKSQPAKRSAEVSNKASKPEVNPFKQVLEILSKQIREGLPVLISTLPRGTFQIIQPNRIPEQFFRSYQRDYHLEDRLTWLAIQNRKVVTSSGAMSADSRFVKYFIGGNGYAYAAAAPLTSPVLDGYPGALQVYRTLEEGDFSAEDLRKLADVARQIDAAIAKARPSRRLTNFEPHIRLTPRPQARFFVFDEHGKQVFKHADFDVFDSQLQTYLREEAQMRLTKLNGRPSTGDRVQLPDSRGDLWSFKCSTFDKYPALGDGSYVVIAMHPTCAEWAVVRPMDVSADEEMSRLVPALKFMRTEFHRGPTLGEIAKQVHLSPFHFHRRFAELFGLTPKHYLLECQITETKVQLMSRRKELVQIAKDCGFAHQSHFTSRFKQATGLTPTRWRRLSLDHKYH